MRRRFFLAYLLALVAGCQAGHAAPRRPPASAEELFAMTQVPRLDLVIDQAGMAKLAAQEKTAKGKGKKAKYVEATMLWGPDRFEKVGVKLKGNRSRRGLDSKPALKLDFEKFAPGRTFLGLSEVSLNNLVEDPTMLREALAYELFRAAGVPAPRVAYVELYLNGERYGLYLLVESVDARFAGGSDRVYEAEFGCDLYAEDVGELDREVGDGPRDELAALAAAADRGPRALLLDDGAPLAGGAVLAYLAVSAFVGDFDGYRHAHNYRLRRGADGRWSFVPSGLDRVFQKRLDIHDSGGRVAAACFADARCRAAYDATMRLLAARYEQLGLDRRADELATLIDEVALRDPKRAYGPKENARARKKLRAFLAERAAEVRRQADGPDDADGDGHGALDCDDRDGAVHPGALEICGDGVDNDCSGLADDAPACGCRVVEADGAEFHLCDLPMTWDDAAAFCAAKGLALARIDTAAQAKAVHAAAKAARDDRWWIGLRDRDRDGVFRWPDGEAATYANFAKSEPDEAGCRSTCVAVKPKSGKWQDLTCTQRKPFVCR